MISITGHSKGNWNSQCWLWGTTLPSATVTPDLEYNHAHTEARGCTARYWLQCWSSFPLVQTSVSQAAAEVNTGPSSAFLTLGIEDRLGRDARPLDRKPLLKSSLSKQLDLCHYLAT